MKKNNNISEKKIINNYLRKLNKNKIESFDFKNDAAFIKVPKNTQLIVTNDTIVESVDFFKNDPPESIANKIAIYNLSDISAMGAKPYAYTLSLSLPQKINKIWLSKFSNKLNSIQKKFNFFLLGGDISKSNKIVISCNFFGYVNKDKILSRNNCKLNDDIWITGNLGESSIGLKVLQKKIRIDNIEKKYFIKKYLFPKHFPFGNKINNYVSSAIDISDGFYGDLENLLEGNNFGAFIESSLIPFSTKTKLLLKKKIIDINFLLSSGDDYQLIFTAHKSSASIIKRIARKNNIKISKVGKIIDKKGIFVDDIKIQNVNKSYKHFF